MPDSQKLRFYSPYSAALALTGNYRRMFLMVEYLVLFGPLLAIAAVGLAVFPLGLFMGSQGMLLASLPIVLIELFALCGLYGSFQLVRKGIDSTIVISSPAIIAIQIFLGFVAVIAFCFMGVFNSFGWHLYVVGAPIVGVAHLVYLNKGYLFAKTR